MSDSDAAGDVRIQPKNKNPTESGNEDRHHPRTHAARESDYHDYHGFDGKFRIVERGTESQQSADSENHKSERLAGPAQFRDDCTYHAKEDERLAFLEIRRRIETGRTARIPGEQPGTPN